MDLTDTKRIIRKFLNSLMPINVTAYFHGMNILLERHILPKLSQQETDNLDSSISVKEIKFVVKNLPLKTVKGLEGFTGAFYQTFKEEIVQILFRFFKKKEEMLPKCSPCEQGLDEGSFSLHSCALGVVRYTDTGGSTQCSNSREEKSSILEKMMYQWLYSWIILPSIQKML